jgi:choline kinase
MKIVILAAGMGTRLGNSLPKTMTILSNGKSILENQLECVCRFYDIHDIILVTGYKKEIIMESHPELTYVYNERFNCTNTAGSLILAIRKIKNESVLWMNADVFFEGNMIENISDKKESYIFVNRGKVGREEIKYTLSDENTIVNLSKTVENGLGEAVGINYFCAADLPLLIRGLEKCGNNDYFEKGIEFAIEDGAKIKAFDIGNTFCVEIDFKEDLHKVNTYLSHKN